MRAKHDDLVRGPGRHVRLTTTACSPRAAGPDRLPGPADRALERPGRATLTAAMPAAWGVNADGTTGPHAGATGPVPPVLPAAARLAEIPGVSVNLARADHRRVG